MWPPRYPPVNGAAVPLVRLAKLPCESRFFIKHDEEVKAEGQATGIDEQAPRREIHCPARDDGENPNVHGIAYVAIQTHGHKSLWCVNRCRSAAPDRRKAPHAREVNDGTEQKWHDPDNLAPAPRGVHQRGPATSDAKRKIHGDCARDEHREEQVLREQQHDDPRLVRSASAAARSAVRCMLLLGSPYALGLLPVMPHKSLSNGSGVLFLKSTHVNWLRKSGSFGTLPHSPRMTGMTGHWRRTNS